jgi:hypothetical protein
MTDPILVSLHLPKTAGTSFAAALQAQFGSGYRPDYEDFPMHTPPWPRRLRALRAGLRLRRIWDDGITCVHGHFLPLKYRCALAGRQARYATWLRDPVERVVSHYHFWRRDYDGTDPAQPLRNRMFAEDWSLERFALGPEMRNLYTQYLWGFDPRRFAFIGITERYDQDLERFSAVFGGGGAVRGHALRNPDRTDEAYAIADALRERLSEHHARDIDLYRWARDRGRD